MLLHAGLYPGAAADENYVLLGFSLLFYAWGGPRYLLLLLGEVFITWFCALKIQYTRKQVRRRFWMILECVLLLGLLGIFKYLGFFSGILQGITGFPSEIPQIVLPIGISFYTFQLLSYAIDVHKKKSKHSVHT